MTSFVTPIEIQNIVKDLRKIVVDLRENEKVSQSLTYAHRVADIIQRRSGDTATRHIPGQDFEKEHKISRNRQLRDLDNENRQLRQLYEDSQWTLHLVMEEHRRVMMAHIGNDDFSSCKEENEVDDNAKQRFHQNAAQMARKIHDFFEHEEKINAKIQQRIKDLQAENDLLRRILDFEAGVDFETMANHLKNRTSKSPSNSNQDNSACFSKCIDLADRNEESNEKKTL